MLLIDADELKKKSYKHTMISQSQADYGFEYEWDCVDIEDLENAPTVDAEPVRHGHWEKYGMDIPEHPWHCSECGWSDHHIEQRRIQEFKACPNCGAKMDEEVSQ